MCYLASVKRPYIGPFSLFNFLKYHSSQWEHKERWGHHPSVLHRGNHTWKKLGSLRWPRGRGVSEEGLIFLLRSKTLRVMFIGQLRMFLCQRVKSGSKVKKESEMFSLPAFIFMVHENIENIDLLEKTCPKAARVTWSPPLLNPSFVSRAFKDAQKWSGWLENLSKSGISWHPKTLKVLSLTCIYFAPVYWRLLLLILCV